MPGLEKQIGRRLKRDTRATHCGKDRVYRSSPDVQLNIHENKQTERNNNLGWGRERGELEETVAITFYFI